MSGFSIDWLDLRETADGRARDSDLLRRAQEFLERAGAKQPIIVDLGAGTGATLRAFTRSQMHPDARWQLVDHDAALLTEARRRHGGEYRIETFQSDLAEVDTLPLRDASLITASALFDLVSADFIETLTDKLMSATALYAALNYDGRMHWQPGHPLDGAIRDAFNRDQQRDKGFGPALGPEGASCLQGCLAERGYTVHRADSPWLLEAGDSALICALIEGIAGAVAGDEALAASVVKDWAAYRLTQAGTGRCRIGHVDILALPMG